jgi:hypothetical protein
MNQRQHLKGRRITYSQITQPFGEDRPMSVRVKVIASTLVIVLNDGQQEIEREGRRRAHDAGTPHRLETGHVLKVMAPS